MTTALVQATPVSSADASSSGILSPPAGSTQQVQLAPSGGGLFLIARGRSWEGWELTTDLMAEISTSGREVMASTYLEIAEYGVGASLEDAVADLLTSLSDYRESLEKREDRLGPPAVHDLEKLRKLIVRQLLD